MQITPIRAMPRFSMRGAPPDAPPLQRPVWSTGSISCRPRERCQFGLTIINWDRISTSRAAEVVSMAFAKVTDRYSGEQIERFYATGVWRDTTMFGEVAAMAISAGRTDTDSVESPITRPITESRMTLNPPPPRRRSNQDRASARRRANTIDGLFMPSPLFSAR